MAQSQGQGRESGASVEASHSADMVGLQVMIRPDHLVLLRGFAEREGATVEALASLWLEEKVDEVVRSSRSSRSSHSLPVKDEPRSGE